MTFRFYNKGKAAPNVIIPFFFREEKWKNWSTINCLRSTNQWQSMNRNNTSLENTLLVFSVCLHSLLCWPSLQSHISQALELQERWGEDQVSVSIFALSVPFFSCFQFRVSLVSRWYLRALLPIRGENRRARATYKFLIIWLILIMWQHGQTLKRSSLVATKGQQIFQIAGPGNARNW